MPASEHQVDALKREARDRAFRQELAEATLKAERQRWLRVAKKALSGEMRPLQRMIQAVEHPVPIYGSAACASDGSGEAGETEGLDPKDESAVAESDAPQSNPPPHIPLPHDQRRER